MSRTNRKKHARKRLYVDPKVQGALAVRVVLYWGVCVIAIALMLLCWRIVTGPARMYYTHFGDLWFFYGPAAVASFLLLPLVVIDILRLSNRFAGPLVRLRRSMRALARGRHVEPIEFRSSDFWQEIAEQFNGVIKRVEELENASAACAGHNEKQEGQEEPVTAAAE